jgi:hypothetical protein
MKRASRFFPYHESVLNLKTAKAHRPRNSADAARPRRRGD